MNLTFDEADELVNNLLDRFDEQDELKCEVIICPPFPYLELQRLRKRSLHGRSLCKDAESPRCGLLHHWS